MYVCRLCRLWDLQFISTSSDKVLKKIFVAIPQSELLPNNYFEEIAEEICFHISFWLKLGITSNKRIRYLLGKFLEIKYLPSCPQFLISVATLSFHFQNHKISLWVILWMFLSVFCFSSFLKHHTEKNIYALIVIFVFLLYLTLIECVGKC